MLGWEQFLKVFQIKLYVFTTNRFFICLCMEAQWCQHLFINTLRAEWNGWHFAHDNINCLYSETFSHFNSNFVEICSDDALVLNRWQAITRTYDDLVYWSIYVSPGFNELTVLVFKLRYLILASMCWWWQFVTRKYIASNEVMPLLLEPIMVFIYEGRFFPGNWNLMVLM